MDRTGFQNEVLEGMAGVGAVDAHSAVIWFRAPSPGPVRVRWWREGREDTVREVTAAGGRETDCTGAVRVPRNGARLRPGCSYRFEVADGRGGTPLGGGRFETAPERPEDTPSRFSIGVMSCHQPFDPDGAVRSDAALMLLAARRALEAHEARFVLLVGDQMYSDFPENLSLFDPAYFPRVAPPGRESLLECTPEEVRRLYHPRYRHFWSLPQWQALQARFPCYPIIDDHDIVDNWGSVPAHEAPAWRSVGEGARLAYLDYQHRRVRPDASEGLPEDFHYEIDYGHTATFVMDLRSSRTAGDDGRLYGDAQADALDRFLARQAEKKVLLLVLSVPLVHLPKRLARLGARLISGNEDFSDRWSSGGHLRDRDRLLHRLHRHQLAHPRQHLVLVSGDIHLSSVHALTWNHRGPTFHQLVSSAITHAPERLVQHLNGLLIRWNREVATRDGTLKVGARLLPGTPGHGRNPYDAVNVGLLEVETERPGADPTLRFLVYGHREGEPVLAFRSEAIRVPGPELGRRGGARAEAPPPP